MLLSTNQTPLALSSFGSRLLNLFLNMPLELSYLELEHLPLIYSHVCINKKLCNIHLLPLNKLTLHPNVDYYNGLVVFCFLLSRGGIIVLKHCYSFANNIRVILINECLFSMHQLLFFIWLLVNTMNLALFVQMLIHDLANMRATNILN